MIKSINKCMKGCEIPPLVGLIVVLLISQLAFALQINPTSISESLDYGKTKTVSLNVTNDLNETKTLTIYSSDTTIVQVGATSLTLSPYQSAKINIFLIGSKVGQYTTNIYIGDTTIPVSLTISPTSTTSAIGDLEPSLTKARIVVEANIQSSMLLSFRNKYLEPVELRDIYIEGSITTAEGMKPLGWSGKLKTLEPGEDLTITILLDTRGVTLGTYPVSLSLIAYKGSEKIVKKVDFEILITPQLQLIKEGTIVIEYLPLKPIPSSLVSVTLKDESGKIIDGSAKVTVFDLKGNQLSSFDYSAPFKVEADKKYCVKAEAPYRKSSEKCFEVVYKTLYIKLTPEKPAPNETVMIQLLDEDGNLATSGTIKINNDIYPGSQISLAFEEGNYTIVGEAQGFTSASKQLEVTYPKAQSKAQVQQSPFGFFSLVTRTVKHPIFIIAVISLIVATYFYLKKKKKKQIPKEREVKMLLELPKEK
jgi:hypothetical protein